MMPVHNVSICRLKRNQVCCVLNRNSTQKRLVEARYKPFVSLKMTSFLLTTFQYRKKGNHSYRVWFFVLFCFCFLFIVIVVSLFYSVTSLLFIWFGASWDYIYLY